MSTLLGETVVQPEADAVKAISEKLEVINLQLAQRKLQRRRILHGLLISLCVAIVAAAAFLVAADSPYLGWDYGNPELAVAGVLFHAWEWVFIRLAPVILIAAMVGVYLTRKKE